MVCRPALRGVDLVIVRRLERVVAFGTTIFANGCTAPSSEFLDGRVLLSARLCMMVLLSCRTARVLAKPPELDPEVADSSRIVLAPCIAGGSTVEVSIRRAGDRPLSGGPPPLCPSSSTQPAGVGGTGPSAATPSGGGRRVGGEAFGAGAWFVLVSDG